MARRICKKTDGGRVQRWVYDRCPAFLKRRRREPESICRADEAESKGQRLINYIASHDGFTLCDLVSYEERHNEDNGEQNRDGEVQNYSWNCRRRRKKAAKRKFWSIRNRSDEKCMVYAAFIGRNADDPCRG